MRSPPLRIAVLNQREGGGATAVARDLLAQAADAGHTTAWFPDAATGDAVALLSALDAFEPDLVHAHCFYNVWPPGLLARISEVCPVVFTVHDCYPVNQYGTACWECDHNRYCVWCPDLPAPKRYWSIYRVRERMRRERAWRGLRAHVVAPSAWMLKRISRTALSRLPSEVIPIGVDAEVFRPRADARPALAREGGPIVLAAGSMYSADDDRKGLPSLILAFSRHVDSVIPGARLVIAGSVPGVRPARGVEFLGSVERDVLAQWYSAADVFVQPSFGDNSPVTVLEAMASGCAVIGTRVGGIPEQVVDGQTGVLVRPGDVAALGTALLRLLRDRTLARQMGAVGRDRARIVFSRSAAWKAHEALYARAVAAFVPRASSRGGF